MIKQIDFKFTTEHLFDYSWDRLEYSLMNSVCDNVNIRVRSTVYNSVKNSILESVEREIYK